MNSNNGVPRFPPQFIDALTELANIGIGRAASVLNQMVNSPVTLTVPQVEVGGKADAGGFLGKPGDRPFSSVRMNFSGDIAGAASLLFPPDSAYTLVSLLTGEKPGSPDIDALKKEALNEVGNILINGIMGSIANMCEMHISYNIPTYNEGPMAELFRREAESDRPLIIVHTTFLIKAHHVEGKILILFKLGSMDALMEAIEKSVR